MAKKYRPTPIPWTYSLANVSGPANTEPFKIPTNTYAPAVNGEVCDQLIANTELDVIDFGDGTGSAEPWAVLWDIVYFDSVIFNSPSHSLVLEIGDGGDPTPTFDGFGQAFNMPEDLNSVTIEYSRRIDFANPNDDLFYELWTVDDMGFLDQYITGFNVGETPGGWSDRMGTVNDAGTLNQMEGELMALVFANGTTDLSPPNEVAWFDDIMLTACYNPPPGSSFMPYSAYNAGTGPICIPPSESPPDGWYNDRGLTETGANCNSTLSTIDDRDYYNFTPNQSGNHTIHLRNLPAGSNWSASVYNDTEPPPPGPTNGGTCFTSAPGDGDKSVVCNFIAGSKICHQSLCRKHTYERQLQYASHTAVTIFPRLGQSGRLAQSTAPTRPNKSKSFSKNNPNAQISKVPFRVFPISAWGLQPQVIYETIQKTT